ncbi:MAG: hypothetical protein AAF456_01980 [Planctomycetota bacterium]
MSIKKALVLYIIVPVFIALVAWFFCWNMALETVLQAGVPMAVAGGWLFFADMLWRLTVTRSALGLIGQQAPQSGILYPIWFYGAIIFSAGLIVSLTAL